MSYNRKQEIVQIAVEKIKPYPGNPRINEQAVPALMENIRKMGFRNPLYLAPDLTIIAGHTRLKAARALGMTEVDCIIVSDLTEAEMREMRLSDNRLSEFAKWDIGLLSEEIEWLEDDGADLEYLELDEYLVLDDDLEISGKAIIEDEAPDVDEQSEPTVKLGEIWQLGRHRLMCGDSTDQSCVSKLMDGNKADLCFTDPPWNVNYGAVDKGNAQGYKPRTILNDFMGTEDFKDFMFKAFASLNFAEKDGAMTYVVMSAQEWGNMMLTLAQNNFHWSSTIIWNKDRLVLSRKDYHTKYEPIWYGWKEGTRLCPLEDRKQSDVWDVDRPSRSDEHPTMKPVELVARAITNSSKVNDAVIDLFGGSGTTLIACEQLNRVCYTMELDPKYCDVIITRWENFTGQKAIKISE